MIVGAKGKFPSFSSRKCCRSTLWVFRIKTGWIPHNLGNYLCGFYRLKMRNPKVYRYLLRVFTTDPDYRRFVVQEEDSASVVSALFSIFLFLVSLCPRYTYNLCYLFLVKIAAVIQHNSWRNEKKTI